MNTPWKIDGSYIFDGEGNVVVLDERIVPQIAQSIIDRVNSYDEMREALKKCAERFKEYENAHLDKAYHYGPLDFERVVYFSKAARNRQMADMCEAVLQKAQSTENSH